jgi:hypothetical protein
MLRKVVLGQNHVRQIVQYYLSRLSGVTDTLSCLMPHLLATSADHTGPANDGSHPDHDAHGLPSWVDSQNNWTLRALTAMEGTFIELAALIVRILSSCLVMTERVICYDPILNSQHNHQPYPIQPIVLSSLNLILRQRLTYP